MLALSIFNGCVGGSMDNFLSTLFCSSRHCVRGWCKGERWMTNNCVERLWREMFEEKPHHETSAPSSNPKIYTFIISLRCTVLWVILCWQFSFFGRVDALVFFCIFGAQTTGVDGIASYHYCCYYCYFWSTLTFLFLLNLLGDSSRALSRLPLFCPPKIMLQLKLHTGNRQRKTATAHAWLTKNLITFRNCILHSFLLLFMQFWRKLYETMNDASVGLLWSRKVQFSFFSSLSRVNQLLLVPL